MFFINRKRRNTHAQFTKDFGEFPPRTINPSLLKSVEFNVVSLNRWNRKIYGFGVVSRMILSPSEVKKGPLVKELEKTWSVYRESLFNIKLSLRNLAHQILNMSFVNKVVSVFVIVLMSPLITLLLLTIFLWFFIQLGLSLFRIKLGKNTLGYYVPVSKNGISELVVMNSNKELIKSYDLREAVISHEHIHLLQSFVFPHDVCRGSLDADANKKKENALIELLAEPFSKSKRSI